MNGKYFQKPFHNPNYYASVVIFETYKNAVWKSVHSFGVALLIVFLPNDNSLI
jgi:hypothetical protein